MKTAESPLFSVVICTKNRKKHLQQCLDSILFDLMHHYSPKLYEIMVVDAKSTDGTVEMIKKYAIRYPNLEHIQQNRNGLPNARNCGLRITKGRIIVFLDDDVIVKPGYFKRLEDILSVGICVGGVSGAYQKTFSSLSSTLQKIKVNLDKLLTGGWVGEGGPVGKVLSSGFTTLNFEYVRKSTEVERLTGCNMAFQRHLVGKLFFDENYLGGVGLGEDADYSFRVKKAGFNLIVDPALRVEHEDVDDKTFPYSEPHSYYAAMNHVYFFFKRVYDGKALSLLRFVIGIVYSLFLYVVGSTVYGRPQIGLSYLRGLVSGLNRAKLARRSS